MQQRNQPLDALRGFAILAMVLSSSIAFGILPAWMYHAQEPPPTHLFVPTLPGISWVDLVFPFFLFSMGAAIPLALNKKAAAGAGLLSVVSIAARRFVLLLYFAFFTLHMRAGSLSAAPSVHDYLLSIAAFLLLFLQFYRPADKRVSKLFTGLEFLAFAAAITLMYVLPFNDGMGFSWYRSDVIILILANMAFFGTLVWWFTRDRPLIRIGLLLFVMAVLIGGKETGTWNEQLLNASPMPWMYKFYYLQYLFIIIPGTFAGEWFLQYGQQPVMAEKGSAPEHPMTGMSEHPMTGRSKLAIAAVLSAVLIIINVILLFGRHVLADLLFTFFVCGAIYYLIGKPDRNNSILLRRYFSAGAFLLLLGLFFDAFEGGIKKDPPTYSYYFVTSGLAFFMLSFLCGLQMTKPGAAIVRYLGLNGKNPMVAYVTGNLILIPLLHITGLITWFNAMDANRGAGFLKGILFTGAVSGVTVWFTRKGWFWRA